MRTRMAHKTITVLGATEVFVVFLEIERLGIDIFTADRRPSRDLARGRCSEAIVLLVAFS
jgi:hypothetical protein